jgi:enterochelin esterase-like enzyme
MMLRASLAIACLLVSTAPASGQNSGKHGKVEAATVASKAYGRDRRIWVYTPPGYSPNIKYNLLLVFDGADYQRDIPLPAILDSLYSHGKLPPFVAILIDDSTSTARLDDLANHAKFVDFLAGEVLPFVHSRWSATTDPHRTLVTGSSAGGLAAAYVALARPDLFGNVLAQSGAFWRGNEGSNGPPFEWLATRYAAAPKRDIRFILQVGALETLKVLGGTGPVFLDASRRFRDVLRTKGYPVNYTEVSGGQHSAATWKVRLPAALVAIGREMGG